MVNNIHNGYSAYSNADKIVNKTIEAVYNNGNSNKVSAKMQNIFETTKEIAGSQLEATTKQAIIKGAMNNQTQKPETLKDTLKGNFINLVI